MNSDQRVAIITAAGRGIGAACARELRTRGYRLALMSRTDSAIKIAEETDAIAFHGSVTNPDDLKKLVDLTMKTYGRIDAVVNNTGHPAKGDILEITNNEWHDGLDMLLLNVINMAKLVVPVMKQQKSGSIVNISTFSAYEPSPDFPVSSVLRAALGSYTKLFSHQFAEKCIRMNNLLPGFVDSYDVDQRTRDRIPMKRPAKAREIASTVAFLLSKEAGYITGQNIVVDGGLTRSI